MYPKAIPENYEFWSTLPIIDENIVAYEKAVQWLRDQEGSDMQKFQEIHELIHQRNSEIIAVLKKQYPLFNYFDVSGWITVWRIEIELSDLPTDIKEYFLAWKYTLTNRADSVSSRGKTYYMQYPGLTLEKRAKKWFHCVEFDSEKYFWEFFDHFKCLHLQLLPHFSHHSIQDLTQVERTALLILLEHKKNILLFLSNLMHIILDDNFLSETSPGTLVFNTTQSVWLKKGNKNWFNEFEKSKEGVVHIKDELNQYIQDVETLYLHCLLGEWNENFGQLCVGAPGNNQKPSWQILSRPIWEISCVQSACTLVLKFFQEFNTSINQMRTSSRVNFQDICIKRLIRFQREEDNPWNMLFSSLLMTRQLIIEGKQNEPMELIWLLYGWIEFPFIFRHVLTNMKSRFWAQVDIRLKAYSMYDLKNITNSFQFEDYPWSLSEFQKIKWITRSKVLSILEGNFRKETFDTSLAIKQEKIHILCDDNIHSGETLFSFSELLKKEELMSMVASMSLRREGLGYSGKPGSADDFHSFLLEKAQYLASRLPVRKSKFGYNNAINSRVEKVINWV